MTVANTTINETKTTSVEGEVRTTEEHKAGPHISIKAEEVFMVQKFPVTNSLLLSSFALLFFIGLVIKYNLDSKKKDRSTFFYFINFCLRGLFNFLESAMKEKTAKYFGLLGSFFFFILLQNWSGLLPGVGSVLLHKVPLLRANTADLNLSFAFRLFGNIFAGEVLLSVVAFLVPVLVSFPFLLLETFVGIIQAVVFAMLSAVLINLATTKAHH